MKFTPVLLCLLILFMLHSCTVIQRQYRKGFYIDRPEAHNKPNHLSEGKFENTLVLTEFEIRDQNHVAENLTPAVVDTIQPSVKGETGRYAFFSVKKVYSDTIRKKAGKPKVNKEGKMIHPYSRYALTFASLAYLSFLLMLGLMFAGVNQLLIFLILFTALLLLSVIWSVKALKAFRKEPGVYAGETRVFIALIMSGIPLVLGLVWIFLWLAGYPFL